MKREWKFGVKKKFVAIQWISREYWIYCILFGWLCNSRNSSTSCVSVFSANTWWKYRTSFYSNTFGTPLARIRWGIIDKKLFDFLMGSDTKLAYWPYQEPKTKEKKNKYNTNLQSNFWDYSYAQKCASWGFSNIHTICAFLTFTSFTGCVRFFFFALSLRSFVASYSFWRSKIQHFYVCKWAKCWDRAIRDFI